MGKWGTSANGDPRIQLYMVDAAHFDLSLIGRKKRKTRGKPGKWENKRDEQNNQQKGSPEAENRQK